MKLTYVTTKSYPATTADHIYIRELSRGFATVPGVEFNLTVVKQGDDLCGIPTQTIKIYGSSKILSTAIFLVKNIVIYRTRKSENVLITNDYYIGIIIILLKKFFFNKTKLVFDCHLLTEGWKDSFVIENADLVISTSEVLRDKIKIKYPGTKKVFCVWGGVNYQLFNESAESDSKLIRSELGIDNNYVIGYIGGFTSLGQDKGLSILLHSLKYLDKNFKILLVGGNEVDCLEYTKKASDLGVVNRVVICSKVAYESVPVYMLACDILTIPYPNEPHFTNFGFPMKVYEYLATAKPIIYSDLKITNDFLDLFPNAFSFKPDDVNDFSLVVQKVLDFNQKKDLYIKNNLGYSWSDKAVKILNLLIK